VSDDGGRPSQVEDVHELALHAVAPWGVGVTVETEATGAPFRASTDGPAYQVMAGAMHDAYDTPMVSLGQGGSIPLCNVFADTYPDAEVIMMGVEEPMAAIHAPNESVHPAEIAGLAHAEALFLQRFPAAIG
jgi:acetylornithine deacetylase/succinyl-diaminopimelate desuccinylase-like protein